MKPIVVVRPVVNNAEILAHFGKVCSALENMIVTGKTANVFVPDINKELLNFSRLQLGRAKPVIVLKSFFKLYHRSQAIRIASHPVLGNAILNLDTDSFASIDRDYAYCGIFFYNSKLQVVFADDPRSMFVSLPKETDTEGYVLGHKPLSKLFGISRRAQNSYAEFLAENPPDPNVYFNMLTENGLTDLREDFAVTYDYFMSRTRTGGTIEVWPTGFAIIHLIVGYNSVSLQDARNHVYGIAIGDKDISITLNDQLPTENFQGRYLMRFVINMDQKMCKVYITGYDKPDSVINILKQIKEGNHAEA